MKKVIKCETVIDYQTDIGQTFISDDGKHEVTYLGTYDVQSECGDYDFLSTVAQDPTYIRDIYMDIHPMKRSLMMKIVM